jgi:hypothetical protein
MRWFLAAVLMMGVSPAVSPAAAGDAVRVLELFQSQGCSSCPPANANLNALAGRPDVIALSFGVTYWDYLGWKDGFAQPAFTARQRAYGKALRTGVYTPQMVVNGRADLVGGVRREVEAALAAAPVLTGARLTLSGGGVAASAKGAELWLVGYDPGIRLVSISAGENSGRKLPHRNIVTSLRRLGAADGRVLALPAAARGEARVVLLQAAGTGPILDAVRL